VSDDRHLTLWSGDLLSKWGFNDGDKPDNLIDWLEADGIDYVSLRWRPVLQRLVREHLLPRLDQDVVVYDIETSHNPIRAESVDGVRIDSCADNDHIVLTPDHVDVPYVDVLAAVRAGMADPTE
jgi:hypothetical protein